MDVAANTQNRETAFYYLIYTTLFSLALSFAALHLSALPIDATCLPPNSVSTRRM